MDKNDTFHFVSEKPTPVEEAEIDNSNGLDYFGDGSFAGD